MKNAIDSFRDQYDFLSNFHRCGVAYEGLVYPSSENAYQAAKTLNLKAREVFTIPFVTPALAKHLGQALSIRPNWDKIKLVVMNDILVAKFSDDHLRYLLLQTADAELIEGNEWGDTYWGVCRGKGSNFLGKMLMDLRKKLAKEEASGKL